MKQKQKHMKHALLALILAILALSACAHATKPAKPAHALHANQITRLAWLECTLDRRDMPRLPELETFSECLAGTQEYWDISLEQLNHALGLDTLDMSKTCARLYGKYSLEHEACVRN